MSPDSVSLHSTMHPLRNAGLETSLLPSAALSPALRDHSVDSFAARNNLRTPPVSPALHLLQKCLGITLSLFAWLVFLAGLAHLILAAVHNQQGELGLGMDSTLSGAKYCLASFLLAGAGLPQWVIGSRKLQSARANLN